MQTLADVLAALSGFGYNDYLRHLKFVEAQTSGATPLRLAILRTYTAEPVEPVLKLRLMLDGYSPTCWFGGYNQHAQEILDASGSLRQFSPDIVLMLVRPEELVPDFAEQFGSRPPEEWSERLAAAARELVALAQRAASDCSAQVIIQNAALARPHAGIFDVQREHSQAAAVQAFNQALSAASEASSGVFVWDFARLALAHGLDNLYDAKSWYVSRNPFRQAAYPALGEDLARYVRAVLGRVKKCVVLDLDNTLWGGVAGEDGLAGVRLGHTYPGNCYRDFQRALLRLCDRGILLAINSKNNEGDAWQIIDEHPDMVLRRHHFAAVRINWDDKAANLRALARELNIGLDSLIFIDDNPAECELVRRECPGCEVVLLPDKPYLLPAVVDALPGVENIRITGEDRRKGELYRARAAQREEESRFSDVADFLRSLDMEVAIEPATPFSVPRIAQLTQKTNQWNMTTRRYTEAQIAALARDPAYSVLAVSARDRFGDHGIIGVLIAEYSAGDCRIDTFLLSCRVIGRGIEQMMLAYLAERARARHSETLSAEFIPTSKNKPAEGFYDTAGFAKIAPTAYRADLRRIAFPAPAHIRSAAATP